MTDSTPSPTTEPHPLSLEPGFLQRLRSWRDALPWLCVGDALRPASSVISWLLVGLALALQYGITMGFATMGFAAGPAAMGGSAVERFAAQVDPWLAGTLSPLLGPWVTLLQQPGDWRSFGITLARVLCLALIWMLPAGYLLRLSALATAGRLTPDLGAAMRLVARRAPAYLSVLLVPLLVMAACWAWHGLAHWAGRFGVAGEWLAAALALLGIPLAIAAGIIGFGSLFAVPLAWAAISIEREGSGFDGLSRGYEYLLRRPLQLAGYVVLAWLILGVLNVLASGVAELAIRATAGGWRDGAGAAFALFPPDATAAAADGGENLAAPNGQGTLWSVRVLAAIPTIVCYAAGWCLVSWLYLLLRRSANNQEIEDVWEQPRPSPSPLPTLRSAAESEDPEVP